LLSACQSADTAPPEVVSNDNSNQEAGLYDAQLAAQGFKKGGCTACHTIPGVEGAVGTIGPDLSEIGDVAAASYQSRLQGQGKKCKGFPARVFDRSGSLRAGQLPQRRLSERVDAILCGWQPE
jgi:cytochrome c2